MSVALGTGAAGVFANDDELWNYLTMVMVFYYIFYLFILGNNMCIICV